MLKQQQDEAASRECTFHPVINHRSDRLMSERSEVLRVSHYTQNYYAVLPCNYLASQGTAVPYHTVPYLFVLQLTQQSRLQLVNRHRFFT